MQMGRKKIHLPFGWAPKHRQSFLRKHPDRVGMLEFPLKKAALLSERMAFIRSGLTLFVSVELHGFVFLRRHIFQHTFKA